MDSAGIYTDFAGLASLRLKAQAEPENAAGEVAKQFESLFVAMMLKAMRDAVPKDGLFSSNGMDTYQSMFDQQVALDLSKGAGIGLADMIEKQIAGTAAFASAESTDE